MKTEIAIEIDSRLKTDSFAKQGKTLYFRALINIGWDFTVNVQMSENNEFRYNNEDSGTIDELSKISSTYAVIEENRNLFANVYNFLLAINPSQS